jgi:Bacterial transglutaminase-like cysteine proteinase BTLCP
MASSRTSLQRLLAPVARLLVRIAPAAEHWERFELPIEHRRFGTGSLVRFQSYLDGPSRVRVGSLEEIRAWLLTCQYESDESLFASADHWQHPEDFERLRRGDCEDHALWTWRKLFEIGVDAEFVVGRFAATPVASDGHAWVTFRDETGVEHLMETVAKDDSRMVRALAEARQEYVPHFSVTHACRTAAFGGYLEDAKARAKPGAAPPL